MADSKFKLPASVYALVDPRTGLARYIGCTTKQLERRLRVHVSEAKCSKNNYRRLKWIRSLVKDGHEPKIVLVESVDDVAVLFDRERFWIAHYKNIGVDLVNSTDGGEGVLNLSADARRKIGDATRNVSFAERQRRSERVRARPPEVLKEYGRLSALARAANRKLLPPKPPLPPKEKKVGGWRIGRRHTEETKARMSAIKMGNTARLGMPHTEATKAKQRMVRKTLGHPTFKLNWEKVAEIRAAYTGARGQQTALAREYGITGSTMNSIVHNKIWILD